MQQELTLVEDGTNYNFVVAQDENGNAKRITVEPVSWEPADGTKPWRVALHPWTGGLGPNRINPDITMSGQLANRPAMVYAKSNADASNDNYLTFPPLLGSTVSPVPVIDYPDSYKDLAYGAAMYGGVVVYLGPASVTSALNRAVRNFNGKPYLGGGQYLFRIDGNLSMVLVKDFGAGKIIHALEVFNNELVVAMGETEKLWTMNTAEVFTQASDNTFAIALGRTDQFLWRAESTNKISNCITAPRTLASWVPASPSQYSAGDTSYSITDLVDYGGTIVAVKPDGIYMADQETKFHNQTPQLAVYPHADNGKGTFTAWGYLWVPSVVGLLRVSIGESVVAGPEVTHRPDYRFWIRGGVEWNGDIYLLCTDEAESEDTFICKMMRIGGAYVYHEWVRLGSTEKGYVIIVDTDPSLSIPNPTMIAGIGDHIAYCRLGRGSGVDVDDINYRFGVAMELEEGAIIASDDLGIEISLIGVKVVGKQHPSGTLRVYYDIDKTGVWKNMVEDVDDAIPVYDIDNTGYFSAIRYVEATQIAGPDESAGAQVNASANDALESNTGVVSITTTEPISDDPNEWLGFRFTNVQIPPGATIVSASMSLSIRDSTFDEPKHTFYGDDVDNSAAFAVIANNISSRARTAASVLWDNPDLGVINPGDRRDTPDLSTIIQEIVSRPGWAQGNAISLFCNGDADGNRDLGVRQWDFAPTGTWAAILSVVYTMPISQIEATGHALNIKLVGENSTFVIGPERTEIDGMWAFGDAHPDTTDMITIDLYNDTKFRIRGLTQGRSSGDNLKILNRWMRTGKILDMHYPDYYSDQMVRVRIAAVNNANIGSMKMGEVEIPANTTRLVMRRVDFSGDFDV